MPLSKNEFLVLREIVLHPSCAQRKIVEATGLSLGSVNSAAKSLTAAGLIADGEPTEAGTAALAPYRVENAVILAAGLSSRFAPISYEKPKGLLKVRGEVLVERQIEQLLAAGITDITVVVGYKKEYFFYLEDKFGVSIVVNPDYASRNNSSSIKRVKIASATPTSAPRTTTSRRIPSSPTCGRPTTPWNTPRTPRPSGASRPAPTTASPA